VSPAKESAVGWPVAAVEDLCEIQLGKMLSPKTRAGIRPRPYLRNANVVWNRFDLSSVLQMDSERSWTVARKDIEAKNYDLKAVNPNARVQADLRTPEELLDLIEAKGRGRGGRDPPRAAAGQGRSISELGPLTLPSPRWGEGE
jgi:hypothetical protein